MYLYGSTVTVSSTSFTSCSAVSVGSLVFVHQSEHHTGAHKHVIKIVVKILVRNRKNLKKSTK